MKRYMVYHGRKPINGISASDYTHALEEARKRAKTYSGIKISTVRVRYAKEGTALYHMASGNY